MPELTSDFTQIIHSLVHRALSWQAKGAGRHESREKDVTVRYLSCRAGQEVTFMRSAC